jgi:hypothetical protein
MLLGTIENKQKFVNGRINWTTTEFSEWRTTDRDVRALMRLNVST